jgi:signal transduction histidine kinase
LVLLALALFVAGLPALYDKFRTLSIFDDFGFDRREVHANLIQIGLSTEFYAGYYVALNAIFAMVCYATATIIFLRRSTESIALFAVVVLALHGAASSGAIDAVGMLHPLLGWLSSFLNLLGYATLLLLFYLFPDGRFVPRWTRWVVIIPVAYGISVSLFPSMPFSPGHRLYWPTLLGLLFTGVFAQVYRYWRFSSIVERQQTKWVVFGFVIAVTGTSVTIMITRVFSIQPGTLADLVVTAGLKGLMLLIPLSFAIAILKFHLWDIDVIINRTLVYGALTVCVAGMYVLVVGSVGVLLQPEGGLSQGSLLVSLLASGVVAILFAPLRERLQRGVNRLVYGERDDPYGVLSHLGKRLEATLAQGAVLPTIVETVASALKLPYAAIAIKQEDNFKVAAAYGSPVGEPTVLPLTYGSETIGQLILAPRAPGESFSAADRRLLEDLARNAEVAVHAVRLTADLQRSRERLVSAREEERRRLRRDLHDGLGPTLGSLALGLDVSLKLLKSELPEAEKLLYHLKAQTQDAVADIRRLVYGLRPPALDDLGLVPAIRQQASNHGTLADDLPGGAAGETNRKDGLIFFVEAPKNLPPLPAAVEVACYRIAQEAMTNVARHARASSCGIHLSHDAAKSELRLEVIDDGIGLPEDRRAGVGLSSMVERAEELGGTLSVGPPSTGGTRVVARLPLFAEGEG